MNCSKCGKQNDDGNRFCEYCGNKMDQPVICPKCGTNNRVGWRFCYTCGNQLNTNVIQNQPASGINASNKAAISAVPVVPVDNNPPIEPYVPSLLSRNPVPPYTVFEKFYNGKEWYIITNRSLIMNKMEYPYAILTNIDLLNTPTRILNGVAGVFANGQYLSIGFQSGDSARFMAALEYANWQIDKAHGRTKNYLMTFQNNLNTRIEVYPDYVIYYSLTGGVVAAFANNLSAQGMTERIIEFTDLSVGINTNARFIRFVINNMSIDIKLAENELDRAVKVVNYINKQKTVSKNGEINVASIKEYWQPLVGEEREFHIKDKVLNIPKEMDLFNSYMLKFRTLASECTDAMIAECERKVNDLITFVNYFPDIYEKYLNAIIEKAIDILVADGIWSVTKDSLRARYVQDYTPAVVDDMTALITKVRELIALNQNELSLSMAVFPMLADRIGDISHVQLAYLYTLIDFDALYHDVFKDFTLVFFPMISEMKDAGKEIWYPSDEDLNRARNIYQNITHPNFPNEKRLEVLLNILKTDPYQDEYYRYMIDQWGENEQTIAIKNYFGFFDLNNPRMRFNR